MKEWKNEIHVSTTAKHKIGYMKHLHSRKKKRDSRVTNKNVKEQNGMNEESLISYMKGHTWQGHITQGLEGKTRKSVFIP